MSNADDYLEALYRDGMRTRDEAWAAFVANLNRLSQMLGSARQYAADFGHLVPPMQHAGLGPAAPTAVAAEAAAVDPTKPPPLPDEWATPGYDIPPPAKGSGYADEEAFVQRYAARREAARDNAPGLDGVMGGRR